jgi:cytochrome P450
VLEVLVGMSDFDDPFRPHRKDEEALPCSFQGETLPMILRHHQVRAAAKDWRKFSSDAPFRIPIPSEEDVRTMRQLPVETDPPEHTAYRKIVEPFFKRAKNPEVIGQVERLIAELLAAAMDRESVEVVRGFALPLQSRALTYLLNVDESEAEEWIGWGIHVFRDAQAGESPGQAFESYLKDKLESAKANPGDDFFSALMTADLDGRTLNLEEAMGFANLAFAGGRDTVIHTISSVIAYLSRHKEAFAYLRENPKHIVSASEEFFRVISPLTHIGRVCPVKTEVHGMPVEEKGRVSLCWASANFDEAAFDSPDEVRLDRRPNPHVAFGAGVHLCLGAAHARLIVRALLSRLSEKVDQIKLLEAEEHVENEERYRRSVGYESLAVQFLKQ